MPSPMAPGKPAAAAQGQVHSTPRCVWGSSAGRAGSDALRLLPQVPLAEGCRHRPCNGTPGSTPRSATWPLQRASVPVQSLGVPALGRQRVGESGKGVGTVGCGRRGRDCPGCAIGEHAVTIAKAAGRTPWASHPHTIGSDSAIRHMPPPLLGATPPSQWPCRGASRQGAREKRGQTWPPRNTTKTTPRTALLSSCKIQQTANLGSSEVSVVRVGHAGPGVASGRQACTPPSRHARCYTAACREGMPVLWSPTEHAVGISSTGIHWPCPGAHA
jgi:hypothetical protein